MYDLTKEQKEKCIEIVTHYGIEAQSLKAIEELAELQQELSKTLNNAGVVARLVEELADVKIMITQLEYLLENKEDYLKEVIDKKLSRTLDVIKGVDIYG